MPLYADTSRKSGEAMSRPATPLTLEEFNARCIWEEHIRLRGYLSEHEAQKHFRKTLYAIRRESKGRPTEWDAMVRGWYARYLREIEEAACAE